MAMAARQNSTTNRKRSFIEPWFFVGIASIMIATTIAGFLSAILIPINRHASLSLIAAVHAIVLFAWQLFYLAQSFLVATPNRSLDPLPAGSWREREAKWQSWFSS